jgi:RNase P subunit RPR2
MSNEKTMMLEWYYVTPCGMCGQPIRIAKDPSGGSKPYSETPTVRASCKACGHQEEYPASAVDNRLV